MKIGVLGGTFDPVHNGHIMVADEVKGRLALSEVLMIPAGNPWLKENSPVSPAEFRLEMVRLAIPRRVFTQAHMDYVVRTTKQILTRRASIKGYRIVYQPKFLRHFTARFEPIQ